MLRLFTDNVSIWIKKIESFVLIYYDPPLGILYSPVDPPLSCVSRMSDRMLMYIPDKNVTIPTRHVHRAKLSTTDWWYTCTYIWRESSITILLYNPYFVQLKISALKSGGFYLNRGGFAGSRGGSRSLTGGRRMSVRPRSRCRRTQPPGKGRGELAYLPLFVVGK